MSRPHGRSACPPRALCPLPLPPRLGAQHLAHPSPLYLPLAAGKNTGEAFVQLAQPERTQEAMAHRQRQPMGHRYIE